MRRLALPLLAILALRPWAAAAEDDLELAVKATYLVKFQPFVTWPPSVFAAPDSPFAVCVAGRDPFGTLLDRAAAGQTFDGRAIVVRHLASAAGEADCQILYLAPGDEGETRQALKAVRGRPVLTVTDSGEAGPQGMLNFVMTEGRVRFIIDEDAVRQSGLEISSKLLRLAVAVRRAGAP
jgi:hypothetical protein